VNGQWGAADTWDPPDCLTTFSALCRARVEEVVTCLAIGLHTEMVEGLGTASRY
jgi:hypothetical protein